jgi:hypothetical protein
MAISTKIELIAQTAEIKVIQARILRAVFDKG